MLSPEKHTLVPCAACSANRCPARFACPAIGERESARSRMGRRSRKLSGRDHSTQPVPAIPVILAQKRPELFVKVSCGFPLRSKTPREFGNSKISFTLAGLIMGIVRRAVPRLWRGELFPEGTSVYSFVLSWSFFSFSLREARCARIPSNTIPPRIHPARPRVLINSHIWSSIIASGSTLT